MWSLKQIAQGSKLTDLKIVTVNSDRDVRIQETQLQF